MTITEFLNARLDEDEAAARAAIDPDLPGTNWRWIDPTSDASAKPEDGYFFGVSLRTLEEFPIPQTSKYLPAFAITTADEMPEGVGTHIALHDPARVLRDVAAKRAMVDDLDYGGAEMGDAQDHVLRRLASVYSDHPDFRQEWTP